MLILMGVRYLVPHGFFYSTHALKKHDAPPTFFFQMPYWPLWHRLSERIDALFAQFEDTHIDAEILLVDHATVLPTREDVDTDSCIRSLLLAHQFDFHIVDTDILEAGTIRDGAVHIKDIAARIVICPPGRVVEAPLAQWLNAFERSGGLVLRVANGFDPATLLAHIRQRVQPHLTIDAPAHSLEALQLVTRKSGERTLYFLINASSETLHLQIEQPLVEIALDERAPTHLHEGTCTLAAFDSVLLQAAPPIKTAAPPRIEIAVCGAFAVSPHGTNALRLYDWSMSLLDADGVAGPSTTVPAVPIANQLDHGRFAFAPKMAMRFGTMPSMDMPELHVRYETRFHCAYEGPVELVMEPGSLAGTWTIAINDGAVLRAEDFAPSTAHVRGSLGMDITPHLRAGENALRVDLITDRLDGGLRNPLYLYGDFAVDLDPLGLAKRQTGGRFENYEANGLPFYAGVVEYERAFLIEEIPVGESALVELDFEQPFWEACQLSLNGGPWHTLPWSPYACTVPTDALKKGSNSLRLRVYTSLIRVFEGQRFNHHTHRQEDIA